MSKKLSEVTVPILRQDNYVEWKIKITSALKARNLWQVCQEDYKPEGDEEIDVVSEQAKTLIYSSLDGQTTRSTGVCYSAHELWAKVLSYYDGSKSDQTGIALSHFMELTLQKGESIIDFCGRFEIALNNLLSTEVELDKKVMIYVLTKTMPKEIKEGVVLWTTFNSAKSISDLLSFVRSTYGKRDLEQSNETAFIGYNKNGNRGFKKGSKPQNQECGKPDDPNRTCNYCKKSGHLWKDCYKLKLDNSRKKKFAQRKQANMAIEKRHFTYSRMATCDEFTEWVIDSGATSHITNERNVLKNYQEFDEPEEIIIADGEAIHAYGRGDIFYANHQVVGILLSVLFVPAMAANLFSVKAAVKNGYKVAFDNEEEVTITTNEGQQLKGYNDGCLFILPLEIIAKGKVKTESSRALLSADLDQWHRRLGHCGKDLITTMVKMNMVKGLNIKSKEEQCRECMLGKSCKKPHPSRSTRKADDSKAILHIDTVDAGIVSLGGSRYFVLATEEYSGYRLIEFVAKKSEVPDCVKLMINSTVMDSCRPVICIHTDNGTEYLNKNLTDWLKERGIIHELSSAYNPEQNGLAERSNRPVIEGARTMLLSAKLPAKLWAEACKTSVYVLNRLPGIRNKTVTKYELFHREAPDLGNLHEFGTVAIRLIPKKFRKTKFDPVSTELRFVGYTNRYNTFRLYDEKNGRIIIDCNVRFMEKMPVIQEEETEQVELFQLDEDEGIANEPGMHELSQITQVSGGIEPGESRMGQQSMETVTPQTGSLTQRRAQDMDITSTETDTSFQSLDIDNINDHIHQEILQRTQGRRSPGSSEPTRRITRSMTNSRIPIYDPMSLLPDESVSNRKKKTASARKRREIALFSMHDEPMTVKDAKDCPNWGKWQQAMQEEIQALERNKTWTLVDRKPDMKKPIKTKWIFKIKLNTDGSINRYKARLVAKGYSQLPEIDYKETFAPVASMTTVRMLFAAATQNNLVIKQFDVKTAFLYGDLEEELYMECPEEYPAPRGKVCKLNKSLYGLKQAPRQWNVKFDSFLKKYELKQSRIDKCLYYSEDMKVLLAIYVDDGIVAAKDEKLASSLINYLKGKLEVKEMDCKSYLGFQVIRKRDEKTISLTQSHYVEKVLEKFNMKDCNSVSTPEEVGQVDFENSPLLDPQYPFKELVGSLLYLVTCTRPDIAHAVSIASRTAAPTQAHWNCLKRVLRYLKGTPNHGITFRWEDKPELVGYSDADYANDKKTRRSTTGYVITYGGTPITWRCQRQAIVSLSTTEAEYISGCEMVKELLPLREMMIELRMIRNEPTTVCLDNQSAVHIAKNEEGQQRTKHIDVREKWLSEQHATGKIRVKHIPGTDQKADMLTKPLLKTKFERNRSWLMAVATAILMIIMRSTSVLGKLKVTDPVYYEPSDVVYQNRMVKYDLRIIILNPCELYFSNVTNNVVINTRLHKLCDVRFRTSMSMHHCKFEDFKIQGLMTGDVSTNTTALAEDIKEIQRHKRFAPLIMGVGIILVAGAQTFQSISLTDAKQNIETIAASVNNERKFIQQGTEVFKETRETIHGLNVRIEHLADLYEGITETMEEFPKIIALVNHYNSNFMSYADTILELDAAASQHKASTALFKFGGKRLWQEPAAHLSQLNKCTWKIDLEKKNMYISYEFTIPVPETEVKVYKSIAFSFWNRTEKGDVCWMKYAGPRHVMVNTTSNCYQHVKEHWVNNKIISGHSCAKENQQLDAQNKIYHTEYCRKNFKPDADDIQVHLFNGFYKIYCYGHTIMVNKKNHTCPENVFELPQSENFVLNNEEYALTQMSQVLVNTADLHHSNQVTEQLKIDRVKMRPVNMTGLDAGLKKLEQLADLLKGDIKTVNSPIAEWLTAPFKTIGTVASDLVKNFSLWISIGAFIVALYLLVPILQVAMILIQLLRAAFSAIASPILRLHARWRRSKVRDISKKKIRRYLLEA